MNVLKLQVIDVGINFLDHIRVTLYIRVSLYSHLTDDAKTPSSNSSYINWNAFSHNQYHVICADALRSIVLPSFACRECIGGSSEHKNAINNYSNQLVSIINISCEHLKIAEIGMNHRAAFA